MAEKSCEIKPPSWFWTVLEPRALVELGALFLTIPVLRLGGGGDGHPVMVIPGFGTGDWATVPLRWFLKDRGHRVHGWRLGCNTGYDERLGRLLSGRLLELFERHGRRVSLIGWSLGGLYARELARWKPEMVRCVITLGSPVSGLCEGTRLRGLYAFVSGSRVEELDPGLLSLVRTPPPVPTSAIYSRTDGVASHRCCGEKKTPHTENIQVRGSHCGLIHNPVVFWIIADRLARRPDRWKPFSQTAMNKILYRLQ